MRRICDEVGTPQWQPPETVDSYTIKLKVVTPLFGGGYEAREVDPVTIIRPATIRGHLRFWWRATAGTKYSDANKLFDAERALWGGAANKEDEKIGFGKVKTKVSITNKGLEKRHSELAPRSTPQEGPREGYFLFPFQEQTGDNPAPEAKARVGVEFILSLSFNEEVTEEQMNEVKNTVRAWVAFGGVGARTRRGCGALQVTGSNKDEWLPPADKDLRKAWMANLSGGNQRTQWTTLSGGTIVLGTIKQDPMIVWRELGTFWARFRKGHVGNIKYSPMSGAKWKDYRGQLVNSRDQGELRLAKPYLGLPIIYQLFNNAPFSGEIKSESTGRMASPVILKPLALANGQFVPLVAVLNSREPKKIKIKEKEVTLLPPDRQNDPVMKELQATSALEAVVVAARRHIGKELIRLGGTT